MFAAHICAGGGADVITLTNQTSQHQDPAGAYAAYVLDNDGKAYRVEGASTFLAEAWVSPGSSASLYEARATLLSGVIEIGTFGTWLALSSDRTWSNFGNTGTIANGTFTIEIRDIATSTIRGTATITIESDGT